MRDDAVEDAKLAWRDLVWTAMTEAGVARFPGARGRIPNFTGAEEAAARLTALDIWEQTSALKANPDMPQLPVRAAALAAGKLVVMAVPRLRTRDPFLLLDPDVLDAPPRQAASIKGSAEHGRPLRVEDVPRLDLVICGSVCVNRQGVRIGKGGGFSDLEMGLGIETGWIDDRTTIATTVHAVQLVDTDLPESDHDFRVDVIVTPDEAIRCPRSPRPAGILWHAVEQHKIDAVPALAERADGVP